MKFGLSDQEIKQIITVLKKYPDVQKAFFFGSRGMGNFKKGSDVDLALKGPLKSGTVQKIRLELEEGLPLPYFFDIVDYDEIQKPELKEHIDQWGKEFYGRKG